MIPRSPHVHRHLLDRTIAVAQAIPFGDIWLRAAGKVGGTRALRQSLAQIRP
jgi:hypothetical protein